MDKRKIKKALVIGTGAAAGKIAISLAGRKAIDKTTDRVAKILLEDLYDENMWEFYSSTARIGIQNLIETKLRAAQPVALHRPTGSPRRHPSFEEILLSMAQLHTMPTQLEEPVDIRVTIGKKAARPFTIDLPVMIAPMSYGFGLSRKAKIALAKGSAMAGTSTNSGEGPFLPAERKAAKYMIYQHNRGDWGKTPEIIRQCDAVEIQLGQGAQGGVGRVIEAHRLDDELRKALGYPKGKDAVIHSRHPGVNRPEDLKKLVDKLRETAEGAPIGVKLGAGKYLEADLKVACEAGVDFISLDGAEAATKAFSPILQDDCGVPLMFAIRRAAVWLEKNNYKDKITLLAGGKIRTPGEMLKACALGADAVYIGIIALFAMSHTQVLKAMPFEPPTQIIWYDGKESPKLNVEQGAKALFNFLQACKGELNEGIRGLGKTSLKEVDMNDLMATSELVSKGLGIPMVYEPFISS
jgi:glutamate synthase domain-containing protein 2